MNGVAAAATAVRDKMVDLLPARQQARRATKLLLAYFGLGFGDELHATPHIGRQFGCLGRSAALGAGQWDRLRAGRYRNSLPCLATAGLSYVSAYVAALAKHMRLHPSACAIASASVGPRAWRKREHPEVGSVTECTAAPRLNGATHPGICYRCHSLPRVPTLPCTFRNLSSASQARRWH
jgi:hypothetical protein